MSSSIRQLVVAAAVLSLACSGGGDATPPVTPASISLAPSTLALLTGATGTVSATVTGSNGQPLSNTTIAWSSDQPTIASVNGSGATASVTAVAPGTATIRATSGSATATVQVTVTAPVVPQSIALTPNAATIEVGGTATVAAAITGSNGQPMPSATITWTSEQPAIASVSGSGTSVTVTAIAPGTATIRATSGSATTTAQIVVPTPIVPQSVALTPNNVTVEVGGTSVITAAVTGSNGQPMPTAAVTWASDRPTVATVSASGSQATITGVAGGTATIRATAGTVSSSVAVTVRAPVANIAIAAPAEILFLDTAVVTATPRDAAGNALTDRTVTWSSGSPTIFSVSATGTIRGLKRGTAYLRATSDGRTDSTAVRVYGVAAVRITPDSLVVRAPDVGALLATVTIDRAGVPTGVTWRSLNPTIVSVVAPGTVTAIAPGTARIELRSTFDTTMRDTAIVRVPFPCSEPRPIVLGTPVQDVFTTADCFGNADYFNYTVSSTTVVGFTVSGTDSMIAYPVADEFGVGATLTPTQRSFYGVAAAGTRRVALFLRNLAQRNRPYTLTSAALTAVPACAPSVVSRGTSFSQDLSSACPSLSRVGTTSAPAFVFVVRSILNQPLKITAQSAGFPVRLQVTSLISSTLIASATGAGQPVTITTPNASLGSVVFQVQVSSQIPGGAGTVTITVDP